MGAREIPKQLFKELTIDQHLLHSYVYSQIDDEAARQVYEKRRPNDSRLAGRTVNGCWLLYSELIDTCGLDVFDSFSHMTTEDYQQESYAWLRAGAYTTNATSNGEVTTMERVWLTIYQRQIITPEQISRSSHACELVGQLTLRLSELLPSGCAPTNGSAMPAVLETTGP